MASMSFSRPNSRKESAVSFLQLASSGRVREAYERYTARSFRHHNPYFVEDAASLAKGMEENARQFPNKSFQVQRVLEDGDLVAIHSRVRLDPGGPEVATVHIFRFEGDRVVELWDVGQPVPDTSPNKIGMF